LTGDPAPDGCGHDMFLRELHKRKVPIYAGIDWGFTAPSAITIAAIDHSDNVYVLKAFQVKGMNDPTFIHYCKTRFHRKYKVQMYYPDIANGSGVDLLKQAGLPVATKIDKSINLGVQVIKRLLNVPGTSETKLLIANEGCEPLIEEFERYHYDMDAAGNVIDGKFAEEYDHSLDPLRYLVVMLLGKSRMMVSNDLAIGRDDPILAPDGSYLRAPTFYELADQHAIPVIPPDVRPFDRPDGEDDEMDGGMSWMF
jgi:phage terminase large subunit